MIKWEGMSLKTFITGAAGFIGSQCAYRLFKEGEQAILLDNFQAGSEDNLIFGDADFRDSVLREDIRDREVIRRIFSGNEIGCVFHFAGIAPLPDNQTDPVNAVDVNVAGFVNILEAARMYGAKKVIFASTNAIYENDDRFPSREADFRLPSLIYANTKYAAERFAASYSGVYGMDIACLRFANVYGPHIDCLRKQPPFVGYMIRELHYNRAPVFHSNGLQKRDYVYIDDLLDMAMRARRTPEGCGGFDIVNVSANRNYSVNELFHIAAGIMGKQIEPVYAGESNYWAKYPVLYQGSYPIRPEVLVHEVNKFTLCDNAHAWETYGWKPKTGIEEGLRATIEFAVRELERHDGKR